MLVREICFTQSFLSLSSTAILAAENLLSRLCINEAPKRVLLATDLPFWRASTEAEQRIGSLVNCFVGEPIELKLFFIALDDATKIF